MEKEPLKVGVFLVIILIAYIVYVFMIHPWERQTIVTKQSSVTVSVYDCSSGYPIEGVKVSAYTEAGELINTGLTDDNGLFNIRTYPACIRVIATHGDSKWEGMCLGSGVNRSVSFCFNEPTALPNILYYNNYLGIIGSSSGDVITEERIGSVELSYPTINASVYYPDYLLLSNIMWSERLSVELKDINESSTKQVMLSFDVESVKGEPIVQVWSNKKLIAERGIKSGDKVSLIVPKQMINESMLFELSCTFTGLLFWTTQECNLTNIKATQEYYLPVKTTDSFNFNTTSIERNSEVATLKFYSSTNSSAPLRASINGKEVFSANSLNQMYYTGALNTSTINLLDSGNTLDFEISPGGEAMLEGTVITFYAKNATSTIESFNFTVRADESYKASYYKARFYVSEVFLQGSLLFNINGIIYPKSINKAGWNELIIDKQEIKTGVNQVVIRAQGRFMINELLISYEE